MLKQLLVLVCLCSCLQSISVFAAEEENDSIRMASKVTIPDYSPRGAPVEEATIPESAPVVAENNTAADSTNLALNAAKDAAPNAGPEAAAPSVTKEVTPETSKNAL